MLEEQKKDHLIPDDCRWSAIKRNEGVSLLTHYKHALLTLGDPENQGVKSEQVRLIFTDAKTSLTRPASLSKAKR